MRLIILAALLVLSAGPAWADNTGYWVAQPPDAPAIVIVGNTKEKFIQRGVLPPDATDEDYYAHVTGQNEACQQYGCTRMPDDWWPPFDRRLRNAWEKLPDVARAGNFTDMGEPMRGIGVNMEKAKKIWGEKIQQAAVDELRRATVDVRVAEVQGRPPQEIAERKKRQDALYGLMETVNPQVEAAQTPEELMAVWPAEIKADLKPKEFDPAEAATIRANRKKGLLR